MNRSWPRSRSHVSWAAPSMTRRELSGAQAGLPNWYAPGRQVRGGAEPSAGDHADVLRPVDHPALAVQPAEEAGDATGRLAALVVALVLSVRARAVNASQRPSGDQVEPADALGEGGQRDRLAAAGDGDARAACSSCPPAGDVKARRRPSGDQTGLPSLVLAVAERLGRCRAVGGGQPHLAAVGVLGLVDPRDDERDDGGVRRDAWAGRRRRGGRCPWAARLRTLALSPGQLDRRPAARRWSARPATAGVGVEAARVRHDVGGRATDRPLLPAGRRPCGRRPCASRPGRGSTRPAAAASRRAARPGRARRGTRRRASGRRRRRSPASRDRSCRRGAAAGGLGGRGRRWPRLRPGLRARTCSRAGRSRCRRRPRTGSGSGRQQEGHAGTDDVGQFALPSAPRRRRALAPGRPAVTSSAVKPAAAHDVVALVPCGPRGLGTRMRRRAPTASDRWTSASTIGARSSPGAAGGRRSPRRPGRGGAAQRAPNPPPPPPPPPPPENPPPLPVLDGVIAATVVAPNWLLNRPIPSSRPVAPLTRYHVGERRRDGDLRAP